MNPWFLLLLAGIFEIGFITAFKFSVALNNNLFIALGVGMGIASLHFLSSAIKHIPLSIGYAIWTGIGVVGAVLMGIFLFDESTNPLRLGLLVGLVAALVGLKYSVGDSIKEAPYTDSPALPDK